MLLEHGSHSRVRASKIFTYFKDVRYNVHIKAEVIHMQSANATSFRKNIFSMLEQTIKYNEPVSITTKDGTAILISEEDYNGLMESLFLCSLPGMKEMIIDGLNTPTQDCLPESKVVW